MSHLNYTINDLVAGDDFEIGRTVTGMPVGQTVTKAWLTIKRKASDADPGVIQKAITATNNPGVGHIVENGSGGDPILRFDLADTDTALLTPTRAYHYDIALLTSAAAQYTLERGVIITARQITQATS